MAEYIERGALLKHIDGIWDCNDMVFRPNDHCCNVPEDCKGCKWAETRDAIRRIVENAPAADVRPVVRGKWSRIDYEPHGHDYKCSACGWKNDMPTHFFPNCGADMRGGETGE